MYELFVANKNYSSWSMRPWVLLRTRNIAFEEKFLRFGDEAAWTSFRSISPAGKVPCLRDGSTVVWDSLAITEYLAERHPGVWPGEPAARAFARSASAEMHSSYQTLRSNCSMNCGIRVKLHGISPDLQKDLDRLDNLFRQGLGSFGGPFLAGASFTAVDAFYTPVAFRAQTYGLVLSPESNAYLARLRDMPAARAWYEAGINEDFRDGGHELEIRGAGEIVQDLRRPVS